MSIIIILKKFARELRGKELSGPENIHKGKMKGRERKAGGTVKGDKDKVMPGRNGGREELCSFQVSLFSQPDTAPFSEMANVK